MFTRAGARIDDLMDEVRVRWLLLDAQQKQVLLLGALYASYTILDLIGALARARIEGSNR